MRTLPVVLDVGTNNPDRLNDPEYLGWRHERITGQAYFDFVDQFIEAVKKELRDTVVHWEDFATVHARRILDQYRDQLLTYNDDIQGIAAVTLTCPRNNPACELMANIVGGTKTPGRSRS